MSKEKRATISLILHENFGPLVAKVGNQLTLWEKCTLQEISDREEEPDDNKTHDSLAVLVQQNLVSFVASQRPRFAEYTIEVERVLDILRYPRYLYSVKAKFGDYAELLLEELLKYGRDTPENLASKAVARLAVEDGEKMAKEKEMIKIFGKLVKAKFVEKAAMTHPDATPEVPTHSMPDKLERFHFPDVIDGKNKAFIDSTSFTANNARFELEFRDRVIISTVTRRIDKSAGKLMELILKAVFSDGAVGVSRHVSLVDIHAAVRECLSDMNLVKFKDHYLKVLEEDRTRFIDRVGDEGGGTFVVNYRHIFQSLAAATVENVVKEKFGSKALRIFK